MIIFGMVSASVLSCDYNSNSAVYTDLISDTGVPLNSAPDVPPVAKYTDDGRRVITIGTWYDLYYISKHSDIHDDPNLSDPVTAQMRLDNMRGVEKKYGIVLNSVNLTYDGLIESINSSVPQKDPDVDVYEIELTSGIAPLIKDYAVSLEEMGIIGDKEEPDPSVIRTMKLPGQTETYLFSSAAQGVSNAYVLAFNMDMIRKAGLENPQDLYDRGEWTWDKWREYLKILTKDTNGDGMPEIYGYSGYWTNLLTNLLFSNNAEIASGEKENLSSPATIEVLKFIDDIYNKDKTARPWDDSNWDINNSLYGDGLSAFWIGADWIFNEFGGKDLPFEIGVVPWPCGPSGDKSHNSCVQTTTKWYFIPKNVKDPKLVYNVIYDWTNWYNGDLDVAKNDTWSREMYMNGRNYAYAQMMASKPGFDMWQFIDSDYKFSLVPMISGKETVDDVVKNNSNFFQNGIDEYFK
ncbi:MAG: ABC transporter substrate-binding protein [Oscillospiraceae bacterium]|nr:ABC transporter substrate-binding protein [Oscillospiraceae bacterium]